MMTEPDNTLDMRELCAKARTLGYRVRKLGPFYTAIHDQDGTEFSGELTTVAKWIDQFHRGGHLVFNNGMRHSAVARTDCGGRVMAEAGARASADAGGGVR
jgi:hypothetical protein